MSRMLTTAGLAALLLAASAPPIAAADPTVTLRLATPESEDRPSEAFLQAFKNAVATASDGSMAVDITYRAGGDDFDPKELNVAHRVMSGEVELAVVPVRTWNDAGVTSFQALSAPLLIDDDALAVAVTTDPLVQPMLDGAAAQGLVGLTLWPEDLRHPFTFVQNGPALLAPDDFMGANIWALPSQLQTEILGALGATAVNTGTADAGVADGTLRGAESGMWQGIYTLGGGMPTATGDITLYPKFQVLVAEDAAWSRLPAAQQAIVRDAATTARDAYLAQRPDDIANGSAYCAAGGTIVDAGSANREAILAAEAPVYARMEADPLAATAIDAIRALKVTNVPTGPAATCLPALDATATIPPVQPGPAIGLVPDGTYVETLTREDLIARGAGAIYAGNNAATYRWTFNGNTGSFEATHPDGNIDRCDFTYAIQDNDRVRQTIIGECGPGWVDFRWRLDGDQLRMTAVDEAAGTAVELLRTNSVINGPLTKVE